VTAEWGSDVLRLPALDAAVRAGQQRNLIERLYTAAGEPAPTLQPSHPSHQWGPERCWLCDCRPYGKWAPLPCDGVA